ncbi:MAG: hypothetical protein B6U97_03695 [Candidatus Altiarchaeales archaeon ex4484_96]|nr:MAG: hypothetical protein B6U97_03695 [Candidatus Altiarchaeales archaeon ex4484_96]
MDNKGIKPELKPGEMSLETEYVNSLLGLELSPGQIITLLEKMRFGAKAIDKKTLKVFIPAYRADILHPIDLVEDVAIAYGYDKFKPAIPRLSTIGVEDKKEKYYSLTRDLMLGFGFEEVKTLIMTNKDSLFKKMNIKPEPVIETKNPVSLNHCVARSWLLPSLLSILEGNKNREYPQRIYETGYCINNKGMQSMKLAGVVAHAKTNYSEIKSLATGLLENIRIKREYAKLEHGSFIKGRAASFAEGFFGELHPSVLINHGLEVPVTAFEFDLNALYENG